MYRPQNKGEKYLSFIEKVNIDSYTDKFTIHFIYNP